MWGSFKKALPRAVSRVSGVVAAKAQPQAPLFTATRATGPLTSRVCRLGQWRGLSKSSAVRGGGAAGRKRAFEADASAVPKSDGFHAAELRLNDAVEDDHTTVIGLRGFFVGHKLDTAALATDIAQFFPLYAQIQGRHNTIFALEEEHAEHPEVGCFMVCFDFGAVVFCNTKNLDVIGQQLVHARGFCERPQEEPSAEEYEVVLDPRMKAWSEISEHNGVGCVRMRELNINNMRIVSTVLAQSVALENYETQANAMMQEFLQTNNTVQYGGSRALLKKESLFKLIAANNSILSDIMINLGVLNRASALEWRIDSYYSLWENLRDEFELERRFQSVEDKLALIADNAKFFLEVLSHRKSEKLEWIIIVLISVEVGFAALEHVPPGMFDSVSKFIS
eukprot:INCI2790.1.p1 GENE.INCI2790.1~~INCI2790.1.p1  ORF type:complete len:394 (-),score=83.36 INCI2790.1:1034-2215(-)